MYTHHPYDARRHRSAPYLPTLHHVEGDRGHARSSVSFHTGDRSLLLVRHRPVVDRRRLEEGQEGIGLGPRDYDSVAATFAPDRPGETRAVQTSAGKVPCLQGCSNPVCALRTSLIPMWDDRDP
jgi:hypothetical protein